MAFANQAIAHLFHVVNFYVSERVKTAAMVYTAAWTQRADVSVALNLYAPLRGPDAKFVLTDRKWKNLAHVKGWTKKTPSGNLGIITEKGETEIIKLMPCTHQCWEQNGSVVALFSVIDDPVILKEESPQKK